MIMRTRFNKAEKEAFTVGAEIEWRHGRYWYPGTIVSPVKRSETGWDECGIRNLGPTTRTVGNGAYITGTPTFVRVPA
jgi:hypothetical protein